MRAIEIERRRHPLSYRLELIDCYPVPKLLGGVSEWVLEGPGEESPEKWTEEEIAAVNEMLLIHYEKGERRGRSYWYLWKKPANSIDSDKRPTYSIDTAYAGRADYVRAMHSHDLTELLGLWELLQR